MLALDQLFVNLKLGLLELAGRVLPPWAVTGLSILLSIMLIAVVAPVTMMYLTWLERKVIARMQNRIGPNRVGRYGLLQPLADGLKMLTKEDIVPRGADPVGHLLAPILVVVPSLLLFSLIPFGRNMTAIAPDVGLLLFLALSSVSTLAIFTAGWASRNKFSILGAMRAVAQLVSYEVPQVFSAVTVVMATGTLILPDIVAAQAGGRWFLFTPWGIAAFLLFFTCSVAEVNRTPFDMPEAESEIIAGFHTEYSGMKFALFYMAEFLNAFLLSALAATLFLGGWDGPLLPSWVWLFAKALALVFVMIWFRGTLPRLRADQLMGLAWKFLLPMGLVTILAAAVGLAWSGWRGTLGSAAVVVGGFLLLGRGHVAARFPKREYLYAE